MSTILIIVLLILLLGGGGYYGHSMYGGAGLGGVLGLVWRRSWPSIDYFPRGLVGWGLAYRLIGHLAGVSSMRPRHPSSP
jgi:hypothetical protein